VCLGNHVLDGVQIPMGRGNLEGDRALCGHLCKTAEPREIPFCLWARMDPKNHVLDGVQIPRGKGQFLRKGAPIVKYRDFSVSCAETAERIDLSFGL